MAQDFDLTYLHHFGLKEHPFSLTPDTGFYYPTCTGQEAENVLLVALANHAGIIKITGEVGTGKTLLCRKLLNDLGADVATAFIPNPAQQPQQLYRSIAAEFGLQTEIQDAFADLNLKLQQHLLDLCAAGRRPLICIDEAQAMPTKSLEALRLLTNVETEKRKLLQIVLFAQPELDQRLSQHNLRQLRQRISFSYELQPMQAQSIAGYLNYRLEHAGYRGAPLFSSRAHRLLYTASGGIPRLINILAHKAMLAAYGQGKWRIDSRHVRAAIVDTEGLAPGWSTPRRSLSLAALVLILLACFAIGRHLGGIL